MASGHPGPPSANRPVGPGRSLLRLAVFQIEDGDGEAVERFIGGLGHDGIDHLALGMLTNPAGDLLAKVLSLLGHRGRENLDSIEACRRVRLTLGHHSYSSSPDFSG